MSTFITKVRAWGWYCTGCKSRKDNSNIRVVKVINDTYITVICSDCLTELVDCFVVKDSLYPHDCDECTDKFMCYTRADAVIEKPMERIHSRDIKPTPVFDEVMKHVEGVRTYTGIYNDKLEVEDKYCACPERDDCNSSSHRRGYKGKTYSRCMHMVYDRSESTWFCDNSRRTRGRI